MVRDTDYAFSVAKIRAVEKRLLNREKLERMIDSKSVEDCIKILTDAEYGISGIEDMPDNGYENLLSVEMDKCMKFIKHISPEPEVFDILLLKNDFHNLKVLIKMDLLGSDHSDILLSAGTISKERITTLYKEKRFNEMPDNMGETVKKILDDFPKEKDPQLVDLMLDSALYEQMSKKAKKFGSKYLTEFTQMLVDLTNIKTLIRVKKMNKNRAFLAKVLLTGGKIPHKVFLVNYEESVEDIQNALSKTGYGAFCNVAFTDYLQTGKLATMEKLSDNFLMSYVKTAKYKAFGLEPLVAYLIAKENEIKNVRIIMTGRLNNISSDLLKERLRDVYV